MVRTSGVAKSGVKLLTSINGQPVRRLSREEAKAKSLRYTGTEYVYPNGDVVDPCLVHGILNPETDPAKIELREIEARREGFNVSL